MGLDDVGELLMDTPQTQRWEAGAQHLAVQRVGQPQRGSSITGHHSDQPAGLQRFQRRRAVDSFEIGEAEPLADRQQFEHGESGVVDVGEVFGNELLERRGRGQRRGEVPHAVDVHQNATLSGATNQLGEHLQVAARQASQLGEGVRRDWTVEHPMEQCAQLVEAERLHLDADQVAVALQPGQTGGRSDLGAHGTDEEDRARHDERDQHRDRRVIEQIDVVDEQHQAVVAGQPTQFGSRPVEQSRAFVVADPEIVHERSRQEVSQGTEWDRHRRRMPDRPFGPPAARARQGRRPPRRDGSYRHPPVPAARPLHRNRRGSACRPRRVGRTGP